MFPLFELMVSPSGRGGLTVHVSAPAVCKGLITSIGMPTLSNSSVAPYSISDGGFCKTLIWVIVVDWPLEFEAVIW